MARTTTTPGAVRRAWAAMPAAFRETHSTPSEEEPRAAWATWAAWVMRDCETVTQIMGDTLDEATRRGDVAGAHAVIADAAPFHAMGQVLALVPVMQGRQS